LFTWSNAMMSYTMCLKCARPETPQQNSSLLMEMAADRQINPRDDIVTKLVTPGPMASP